MEVSTASGKPYATVMWNIPVTKDNSIGRLNLSGLDPPQTLQVGTTNITYYVTDSAGLGSSCTFSVLVKDLEPPKFVSCPNDTKIISLTRESKLMLPAVVATDNVGVTEIKTSIPNGTEVEWGEYEVTYTASDKAKNTASCSFDITIADSYCEKLSPPENGAITCESWMAGLMCTVHCNEGYDMAFRPRPWYYCESDGNWRRGNTKWSKKPTVPECSGMHKPKIIVFSGRYYYLTNKCSGEQLNEEIADKFIGILKSTTSGWGQACRDYPHLCMIEDVEVLCGESRVEKEVIGKNQTAKIPLTISFMLKIPLLSFNNASHNLNHTLQQILSNILGALVNADLTFNTSGVVFQRDPSRPLEMRLSHLICDEGQVLIGEACVNCPLGYYFNGSSCEACAVDHYQDQEAQTSCIACTSGKSTSGKQASKRLQDCQDMPQASASTHQGLSKPVFISIIAAAVVLVVVLISVAICYARKRCGGTQRSAFDKDIFPMGFANMAYGEVMELSPNDLLDSSEA
ncbi:unnamed protein product [Porites evermanni]|uniref:HYR domain-containing protein n=1 Tax=Porites evermanni TaxID=104178 RepID=A0ABN8R1Z5_9CNID|nr:unnamed protein product [Porites evermanni]